VDLSGSVLSAPTFSGTKFDEQTICSRLRQTSNFWKIACNCSGDVYVDGRGVLRTAHEVRFLGLTVLWLHYKLERGRSTSGSREGPVEGGAAAVQDGSTR
jgi:hypothetical protein